MKLTITEDAFKKLEQLNSMNYPYLLLFYDTEECGCGVNGTTALRWKESKGERDLPVDCSLLNVIVHEQQAVFFDGEMKLDFAHNMFRLSSSQGVLNPFISPGTVKLVTA